MNVRFFVICALVALSTASTVSAQSDNKAANAATAAAGSKTWTPDKTPWGDPDLQAVWSGDPKTYTRPYTISIPYTSPEGYQVLPYECHEGNLAILQGLGGERAEDKALEEDAKRGIVRPRRPIQGGLTVGGQPIPEGGPR